ncbi:uncharacterized protein LOC124112405 isoform X2 [Haliotis rufescens]|uniref:uncharacterized protein LOC124112405 isoform X2 n=1 Tax=Haliotis rufescens TaxID=6454 RepID=UPI00201E88A3|nr:uncharacterized protein LOC124112405 isoform X2 [Haliotis rufescens]
MTHYISVTMKLTLVFLTLSLVIGGVYSDTTVTVYPQWLAQGGSVRYESDRWNKHNGLEKESRIANCRRLRTDSGRWIHEDFTLFRVWPEDAHRSGYPDPNYLKNVSVQQEWFSDYLANIDSGYKNEMIMMMKGKSHRFTGINEARLVAFVDLIENYVHQKKGEKIPLIISEYGRGGVAGISKTALSGIVDFSTIYQSNAHRFTQLGLREYIDRSVVFLLSSEQDPGNNGSNWSLFTRQGNASRNADVFKFWYNFTSEYSFIRTASKCDGQERTVSPLSMSSSVRNETVILLHSYSQQSQMVKLIFQDDWITPITGEATCITIKDNWYPIITFNEPFDIGNTGGMVELPPEATCRYTFKIPSNQLPRDTFNETTYYGAGMVIPIKDGIAVTTIALPKDEFDSARLRVSASLPINETNILSSVTFNHQPLYSCYKLYDSDKQNSKIFNYMDVWEFFVPSTLLNTTSITVQVNFSNKDSEGYVTAVALVTAKLVPSDIK